MKPTQPKEHPTFQRAMGLAHKRLMAQRERLASRVEEILKEGGLDEREAAHAALAELAQRAYEEAVDSLSSECARRVRVEYVVDGGEFLDEACRRMVTKGEGLGALLAEALALARPGMPGQVRTRLEFGCREDGLVFGRSRHEALGGNFAALQALVAGAMDEAALREAKGRIEADGATPELALDLAPRMLDSMRPALRAIARGALPCDDAPSEGRPLSALAQDIADRLGRLSKVELSVDNEPWHTVDARQAGDRILQISAEASKPDAAGISRFFASLGI